MYEKEEYTNEKHESKDSENNRYVRKEYGPV
jgi:hypothetical protein